jgi:hypothetical protein
MVTDFVQQCIDWYSPRHLSLRDRKHAPKRLFEIQDMVGTILDINKMTPSGNAWIRLRKHPKRLWLVVSTEARVH